MVSEPHDFEEKWIDWTSVGGSDGQGFSERIKALEKWMRTHRGIDYNSAGPDYPHPSQKVRSLYFYEGSGRLGQDGVEFLFGDANAPKGMYWNYLDFADVPINVSPVAYIRSYLTSSVSPTLDLFARSAAGSRAGQFQIAASDGADEVDLILTATAGATSVNAILAVTGAGGDKYFKLSTAPLWLADRATDPSVLNDGELWYRTDTDKFRARINGVTENLATESYVTAAIAAIPADQDNIWSYAAKTTTYVTLATDGFIRADATSASFTITLITAVGNTGLIQVFKKIDATNNTVTIDANSTETIDGALTYVLGMEDEFVAIISDGANWHVMGRSTPPRYTAVATTYTTLQRDSFVACDATSGAFTITLITAVGNAGLTHTFKKIDSSANIVTIDANGSQTIDGALTRGIPIQHGWLQVTSDGANWLITGRG